MTAVDENSQLLCEEVRKQAADEGEAIVRRAREEAGAIVAKATHEAQQTRAERVARAHAEAERQHNLILSTAPVETARRRLAYADTLLEDIRREVRQRILERRGFNYRQCLIGLIAEALGKMRGDTFVLELSPEDRSDLSIELADEIRVRLNRPDLCITIAEDENVREGVIVRDTEAREIWDNRLLARLERAWPSIRRQLATQIGLVPDEEQTAAWK